MLNSHRLFVQIGHFIEETEQLTENVWVNSYQQPTVSALISVQSTAAGGAEDCSRLRAKPGSSIPGEDEVDNAALGDSWSIQQSDYQQHSRNRVPSDFERKPFCSIATRCFFSYGKLQKQMFLIAIVKLRPNRRSLLDLRSYLEPASFLNVY